MLSHFSQVLYGGLERNALSFLRSKDSEELKLTVKWL
jgi:hypothetical protein